MAKKPHSRGGHKRAKPGKPGWYRIRAKDLLHSLELRHDLKAEVEGLMECLEGILDKYDISTKDWKAIKACVDSLQSATEPIAFGVDEGG